MNGNGEIDETQETELAPNPYEGQTERVAQDEEVVK